MLRPEYLKGISDGIAAQFAELEGMIIWDIARRIESTISDPMNLTATAEIQMKIMKEMGYDMKAMREAVARKLKISKEEIDQIVYDSARMSYEDDALLYQAVGKILPSVDTSAFVSNIIRATQDRLNQDLLNLSNTIGFVEENGKFYGVDDYFKRAMDRAVFQTASGAFDYQSVSRRIIKEMGASGVRTIHYDSGVTRHFESQIRNNLLTGISQMAGQISLQNAKEMDHDIMELTAHAGARPTHSVWQGKLVSLSGKTGYLSTDDIGYGDVAGFQGANCAHMWFPYFEGISERKYTDKQLEELGDQSKKYEFNGKMYSEYEAGQKMRQIERSISRTKRELIGLDATNDKDMFIARSVFLRRQRDLYDEFARVSGQPKQDWRKQVYSFDRSKAIKAVWANKRSKPINNEARTIAKQLIKTYSKIEPEITRDLNKIVNATGGYLSGLENKFKSENSLSRKIINDSAEKGIEALDAAKEIRDILRYTMIFKESNFADKYFESVDLLKEQGYTQIRVKNSFYDGSQYKGINTILINKSNNSFELQYHTPTSFKIKENELHDVYEKYRETTDSKALKSYKELMISISKRIPNPININRIKSFR